MVKLLGHQMPHCCTEHITLLTRYKKSVTKMKLEALFVPPINLKESPSELRLSIV